MNQTKKEVFAQIADRLEGHWFQVRPADASHPYPSIETHRGKKSYVDIAFDVKQLSRGKYQLVPKAVINVKESDYEVLYNIATAINDIGDVINDLSGDDLTYVEVKKTETLEQACEKLKEIIVKNGFEVKIDEGELLPRIVHDRSSYIDIRFYFADPIDAYDIANKTARRYIIATGGICKMDANALPDELYRAADEIKRGAALLEDVANANISYIRQL